MSPQEDNTEPVDFCRPFMTLSLDPYVRETTWIGLGKHKGSEISFNSWGKSWTEPPFTFR